MEKHKVYHPNTQFCENCNAPAKVGKTHGTLIVKTPFGEGLVGAQKSVMIEDKKHYQMLDECLKCPDCGHSWKPPQSEFNQAKFAIEMNEARNS